MWDLNQFKENVAVFTESGEKITYSALAQDGRELKEKIPARSLVLQLCKNEYGSFLGYVTFLNNKIVPIMQKEAMAPEALKSYLERYRPDYIYLPEEQKLALSSLEEIYNGFGYSLLKTGYPRHSCMLHENLALLLTTSGSTGSPKLVRLSYRNIHSNTESIVEYLEIDKTERAITTLPMNYTYGLSVINSHLYAGAAILLNEKTLVQKEFWQHLREFNVTTLSGVPYTYEMLDRLRFSRMNLPALKTLTQAGGKLSLKLHEKFAAWAQQNHKRFVVMYGQTEATARMSYLRSDKSIEKIGSIGMAIPGGKFELVDASGSIITEPGSAGELVYKGRNVALGYAESAESLSLGDEFNGRLHTGDMAKKDEDGFFYIVGRKKRFLKIFGNRVNLDEIELLIKDKFSIADCVCAGFDDNLFIFICDETLKRDILNYVTELTTLNAAAFKFVILDTIPKNESGKALYQELEGYYG